MFFIEKDAENAPIDYAAAVQYRLALVPSGAALDALAHDYDQMVADGLLMDEPESFASLMSRCRQIEEKANRRQITDTLTPG